MSIVTLASGGLDSTLLALMAKEQRLTQYPLYIDYGHQAAKREWAACRTLFKRHGLPAPTRLDISNYGRLIASGLITGYKNKNKAFLPGRNLMFLLFGAAYAVQKRATAVALGLLNDSTHLFPDQTGDFVAQAEAAIASAMGKRIRILAPLMVFGKAEVLALADRRGVAGTYSCHAGAAVPCGKCISCVEIANAKKLPRASKIRRGRWGTEEIRD